MTESRQADLRRALEELQRLPFPGVESDDGDLDALRADLVAYDGHVAGIVSTIVGDGRPEHPLTRDDELAHRLAILVRDKPAAVALDARRLLDYLNALHGLVGLVEAWQEARALASLDAWNRWWRRRGEPGVRALLMAVWDPIGVAGEPAARDEYDSYALQIGGRLRRDAATEELADYLSEVRQEWMGLPPNPAADRDVARRIRTWYEGESGEFEEARG